jgi:cytochrome c oxidase subunit IV
MSVRQSRKGVSAFTTWKLTRLIRVLTLINLIDAVKPMPNWTFIALVYVILISVLLFMVVLYTRYYL